MMDEQTATGRSKAPQDPAAAPSVWKLRVVYVAGVGITQTAANSLRGLGPLTIARGPSTKIAGCRQFLTDSRVSREHARVYLQDSRALVEDLGSKNGTDVNGCRLRTGEACALADGDVLRVGDSFLVVRREPSTVPDVAIPALVGLSQAACELRSALASCAATDCSVLLLGETGTGKEVAAAAIHTLSRRPGKFVSVNCAAIPATLAEGMFFGVKKGAYTGAIEHAGFFGEARDGTLFLDEVGDLPLDLQPKLLRAISTKQATPLGQAQPIDCDARIIAATNRDLTPALHAGSFRQDLYHRLAGLEVRLPTLRQRSEDILLLAAHLDNGDFRPSPALAAAMLSYPFPGNVREVANMVCRVRAVGEAKVISSLSSQPSRPDAVLLASANGKAPRPAPPWTSGDPPPTREEIAALLTRYDGNLSRIETEIGYSRRQFGRWMERYGLETAPRRRLSSPG
jgi:DNA-binding NtrC family response regulator